MKILFSVASIAALAAATLGGAGAVSAHGSANSTCAGDVHGDHVRNAYVGDVGQVGGGADLPGGPGAHGHFTVPGLPPGASFCSPKAHPNGFNTPDHFSS